MTEPKRKSKLKQLVPDNRLEKYEQVELANWLNAYGFVWCHIPNEVLPGKSGKPNYGWLSAMRARGAKAGMPDNLIFGRKMYDGSIHPLRIAIELKRVKGGKLTDDQHRRMDELEECGWYASACRGALEAKRMILEACNTQGLGMV